MNVLPMIDFPMRSHFEGLDDPSFAAAHPGGPTPLALVQVERLTDDADDEASFSLLFRGPADRMLAQATYRLVHPVLGDLDIFLVPIRQDAAGIYYQAIFNRMPLRPPA